MKKGEEIATHQSYRLVSRDSRQHGGAQWYNDGNQLLRCSTCCLPLASCRGYGACNGRSFFFYDSRSVRSSVLTVSHRPRQLPRPLMPPYQTFLEQFFFCFNAARSRCSPLTQQGAMGADSFVSYFEFFFLSLSQTQIIWNAYLFITCLFRKPLIGKTDIICFFLHPYA